MMRSLYSGVSGLKAHQTRMDVIGNNIANVNTTAYKSKSLNFSDMIYQTTQAATAPNTDNGTAGTNPRQIGLGVKTAAINTSITTEGASQSTGNPFDLKITGEAFFIVTDGTNQYFTRDGSFNVDSAGYLCMSNTGYIVEGWTTADAETGAIIQDTVKPIRVLSAENDTYPAEYTTKASINGIIDMYDDNLATANGKLMNIQVLDDRGYEYNLKFGITPSQYTATSYKDIQNNETEYTLANNLYQVDTSTLTYTYVDANNQTKTLSASSSPELMDALDKAVWAYYSAGTNTASNSISGTHALGTADSITVDLSKFIADDSTLSKSAIANGELASITALTVSFSGSTGYTTTVPTYPLSSSLAVTSVDNDAVKKFYTAAAAATDGYLAYTVIPDDATVIALKQTYDNDGVTQTDYTFSNKAGTEIANINVDLYSDYLKVLGLGTVAKTNSYTTQETKATYEDEPGQYVLQLLDITDSDGNEVDGLITFFNNNATSWNVSYSKDDGSFQYVDTNGNDSFELALSALGTNFSNVTFDMSNTSNVNNNGKSTISGLRDDGRMVGNLTGVSIGQDGKITASYDNGMQRDIAQISVATFENAMGLENAGDNLYTATSNSGEFNGVGVDIKGSGTGYMTTGVLEMSNVDLATEFTNMITTQRGFQANSRIITTSDTLLEELVNLKR
jgi:flagellar hook protein FlgE